MIRFSIRRENYLSIQASIDFILVLLTMNPITCSNTLPCPSAPLQSCGCYESVLDTEPHPMVLNLKAAHQTEYGNCMDLKSRGIFVSGKFKFSDGSEELCSGWGKDM